MDRVIALDVGSKTIGLATGSILTHLAKPLMTIKRVSVKKDVLRLSMICQQQQIDGIVVGLPLMLDGSEGRSARLARQVGDALGEKLAIEVQYYDERFSSVSAEEKLKEMGKSYRRRRKEIDQVAAAVILTQWFESLTF